MTVYPSAPQDNIKYTLVGPDVLRRNMITNPDFATALTGWGAVNNNATLNSFVRSTSWAWEGTASAYLKVTSTGAGSAWMWTLSPNPVVPGQTYTASARLNAIQDQSAGIHIEINWYDSSYAYLGGATGAVTNTLGQRLLSVTGTAPANTTKAEVWIGSQTSFTSTEVVEFYADAVMLEQSSSVGTFFVGTEASKAVFNDPTDPDYIGMAKLTGLDGADVRESLEDRAGADGALQGSNYLGRRPVVINVEVVPSSTTDRNQKWTKFKRATNAFRSDAVLSWTPDGGLPQQLRLRRNQPPRRPENPGWMQQWQVGMVAADPWIYGQTLRSASGTSSPVAVTNQGDGQSAPTMAILMPTTITDLSVLNQTTGEKIQLTAFDPSTGVATYSSTIGSTGSGNGQFQTSEGVAVDASGNIFVADANNHRVQKFNSSGVYQAQTPGFGTGNGQFQTPEGLDVDTSGNVFVCDYGNHRVQKFNNSLVYQSQFGTSGTGNGQFNSPIDIAIDGSNNMYVTDYALHRVQKFNSAGTYQAQFGTLGSGANNLSFPYGLDVDSTGTNIYIADRNNFRVSKVATAGMTAVSQWASNYGTADGQFQGMLGLQLDGSNNVWITDDQTDKVQKFNSSGTFLAKIGGSGTAHGQFSGPEGLSFNAAGTKLYIADYALNRVEVYDIPATPAPTIDMDFAASTVKVAGANYYRYVNVPQTSWWKLQPGDNSILVTGATSWTMSYRDAWQ